MPQKAAKLPDATIAEIARWIDLGAPYDRPLVERARRGCDRGGSDRPRPTGLLVVPAAGASSRRPRSGCGVGPHAGRPVHPRRARSARGLKPNPIADRRTLIRRVAFDLIGLAADARGGRRVRRRPAPDAYERLVDRLLASPRYGERWARHWMDVARFAESHGYEQDYDRPFAYHYRDFLIRAFNDDMPYDQFVRWQIAGDELAPDDPLAMAATGFLGAGAFPTQFTEAEFESARYNELDDMVATTGSAFLGLSVGCARCHDHKYDPIPSEDYYRLAAAFTTTIRSEIDVSPGAGPEAGQDAGHGRGLPAHQAPRRRSRLPPLLSRRRTSSPRRRRTRSGRGGARRAPGPRCATARTSLAGRSSRPRAGRDPAIRRAAWPAG